MTIESLILESSQDQSVFPWMLEEAFNYVYQQQIGLIDNRSQMPYESPILVMMRSWQGKDYYNFDVQKSILQYARKIIYNNYI